MNNTTYPVSGYTITMNSGTNDQRNMVATLVIQLSNTAYRAIIRFYDAPYNEMPPNGVYGSDFNISYPSNCLAGFLIMMGEGNVICTKPENTIDLTFSTTKS